MFEVYVGIGTIVLIFGWLLISIKPWRKTPEKKVK